MSSKGSREGTSIGHEARTLRRNSAGHGDTIARPIARHECAHWTGLLPPVLSGRIPLDVIEQIANHLDPTSNGTQGILSMATVCASWYPYCQRILYRDIILCSWDGYVKLAALALNCAAVRRRLAHTRSLLVKRSSGQKAHCPPSFPLVLAGLLPSLTKLCICNLRPPFHPSLYGALPKLGTVTTLALFDIHVNNFHELRRILSAFPHLRDLTIGCVTYPRVVPPTSLASRKIPETSTPCHARLESLSLDWSSNYHLFVCLLRWLVDASVCTNLISFEVISSVLPANGRFMIYDYLDILMESTGSSVKRVVAATEAQGHGLLWLNRSGSLRHCPDLRTLSFRLSNTSWKRSVEELFSVLTSICSSNIEEIAIAIPSLLRFEDPPEGDRTEDNTLTRLHECQRQPIFARLRVVEWRVSVGTSIHASEDAQRLLAPWHARGILRITENPHRPSTLSSVTSHRA